MNTTPEVKEPAVLTPEEQIADDKKKYLLEQHEAFRKTPPLLGRVRVHTGMSVLRGYKLLRVIDLTWIKDKGWLITCAQIRPAGDAMIVPLGELRRAT